MDDTEKKVDLNDIDEAGSVPVKLPEDAAPDPILAYFKSRDLSPESRGVWQPFANLAYDLVRNLPRSAERTVALRKLLESRYAALRAAL